MIKYIQKNMNLKKVIVYCMLILAMLNACLRFTESGATTLYRLFSPIIVFIILVKYFKKFKKEIAFILFLLMYNFVVSYIFYKNISLEYILFSIYIFFVYVLVKYLKITDKNFSVNFMKFLHNWTSITLILCWLQFFIRFKLPFLALPKKHGVNVYLSNENEMGEALSCILIIYLFLFIFFAKRKYFISILCIIFFLFAGDVKLSLLGVFVAAAIFLVYKVYFSFLKRNIDSKNYFIVVVFIGVIFIFSIFFFNPSLKFRDYNISIRDLIFEPIGCILKGERMKSVGSINDRVNAIVFGIKELILTKGFGIGLGNSVKMLEMTKYHLLTAKSMHNIIAQFLVEFGYLAMFVYFNFLNKTISGFRKARKSKIYLLKATFTIAFIFISSQSSIGILSNYYTIIITIYLVLMEKNEAIAIKM